MALLFQADLQFFGIIYTKFRNYSNLCIYQSIMFLELFGLWLNGT